MESFITLHQIWLHSQSTPNNFPLFREENIWRQLWKIHFSANLSLETSENKQTTKKVPPIRRWDCVSANLKAVSSTKSDRFGKNHGKGNSLGENQVFFCVSCFWFMSSCKMLLTGCFEWSNGIWKNAFIEEISNKLCSPHRECKICFENTNFYPFLCILPFIVCFQTIKASKVTIILDI